VNRHIRNNEDRKTTLSRCKHMNRMEKLMEQFIDSFSLPASKNIRVENAKHHARKRS
jgi:hypothetical protein